MEHIRELLKSSADSKNLDGLDMIEKGEAIDALATHIDMVENWTAEEIEIMYEQEVAEELAAVREILAMENGIRRTRAEASLLIAPWSDRGVLLRMLGYME